MPQNLTKVNNEVSVLVPNFLCIQSYIQTAHSLMAFNPHPQFLIDIVLAVIAN
jgi:hypothetical protein